MIVGDSLVESECCWICGRELTERDDFVSISFMRKTYNDYGDEEVIAVLCIKCYNEENLNDLPFVERCGE